MLQTKSVVFVAMRSRLWRCSPEQLRPAFPSEVLGRRLASDPEMAELLRKVMSGTTAGAVDVVREGPPRENGDELLPSQDEGSGETIPLQDVSEGADSQAQTLPQEAPREVPPVPPGLWPRGLEPVVEEPHPPPAPVRPNEESRRSSVQEPAQEPESSNVGEDRVMGAETRASTGEGPMAKQRRVEEVEQHARERRAPGTPIQRLLGALERGRQAQSSAASSSTPRSRSPLRENDENLFSGEGLWAHEEGGKWSFVASRSDEVDIRAMNAKDRALFDESDKIEWKAILATGAVRVISGREADEVRRRYPERILDSRLQAAARSGPVEGKKPLVPRRAHGP